MMLGGILGKAKYSVDTLEKMAFLNKTAAKWRMYVSTAASPTSLMRRVRKLGKLSFAASSSSLSAALRIVLSGDNASLITLMALEESIHFWGSKIFCEMPGSGGRKQITKTRST